MASIPHALVTQIDLAERSDREPPAPDLDLPTIETVNGRIAKD